ncbi:MAG: ABC transporter permease [Muribaculum sp.]|nr:ABC transporter permease [Muribaculaceae bacterium]MCM1080673.1 ABC transporter permease [Muribaculum sp.]
MKIIQILKSAVYQLKSQRLLTWVSISGTAMAIFLIMIVVLLQQVKTAPFAPESKRDRFLHYKMMSVNSGNGYFNGPVSWKFIKECILPLESAEVSTAYAAILNDGIVSEIGGKSVSADTRGVDHNFWKVFDFTFLSGSPLSEDDFNTSQYKAVISASVAQQLFGTTDIAGRDIAINGNTYIISGVVKDVSQLASTAYAKVWYNLSSSPEFSFNDNYDLSGQLSATILAKSVDGISEVKEELTRRTEEFNKTTSQPGAHVVSHDRPYTQEVEVLGTMPNLDPDYNGAKKFRFIIYLILLIVPAINLLSMTQSRLRQRTSEIAIRRAFGQSRSAIITDILLENLLLTLIAGVIGLVMSIVFAYAFDTFLFSQSSLTSMSVNLDTNASISELMHWSTFWWALLFCFILNLISNSIPAWKASRTSITGALTGRN